MKKIYSLIGIFLLGILAFNMGLGSVVAASDDDGDGIDDDFEHKNQRDIIIQFEENKTEIESILRNGEIIDAIDYIIMNDSEGLLIQVNYESEYSNESKSELELKFEVAFRRLIEFVDLNDNGIYEESIDQFIQNYELNSFKDVVYTEITLSNETSLHYFIISTTDNVFTAHIYLSEEFTIVNNTLITPTETKIDIEINNFNYLNNNSQLALYTRLSSESEYKVDYETKDEEEGYSENEEGVVTNENGFQGFFTWRENATIDGMSKRVLVSNLEIDDQEDISGQKLYLNYPRGTHIYHDPKIGIAEFITSSQPLSFFIIIGVIIGAISISIAYGINHYRGSRDLIPISEEYSKGKIKQNKAITKSSQRNSLIKIFEGEEIIDKLAKLGDVNLTVLSQDFLKALEQFNWEINEKKEFIKEMLALTPEERDEILKKMIEKKKL